MAGKIFINYRRSDDPGHVQALHFLLETAFTADNLFMDIACFLFTIFKKSVSEIYLQCAAFGARITESTIEILRRGILSQCFKILLAPLRQPDNSGGRNFPLAVFDNSRLPAGSLQHGGQKGQFLGFEIRLVHVTALGA